MLTEYSKPVGDVASHTARLIADNDMLLARQRALVVALRDRPPRKICIVCAAALGDTPSFRHRKVPYAICGVCEHVQCAVEPPPGYPAAMQDFADIYRPLDPAAFRDRTERIYAPKLSWALRAAKAVGLGDLRARSWVEIGSGAGSFVDALRRAGIGDITGLEAEAALVRQAGEALGAPLVRPFSASLADAVTQHPADVYVAWFVLEHSFEITDFLDAIRQRPAGTVLLLAVPTFGLATLLENGLTRHFARSLDSVLHLQLFTDRSISHAMERAGCTIEAEWIFGQDADDFYRVVMAELGGRPAGDLLRREAERLTTICSAMQEAIDRAHLSDARHILAVRR